MTEKNHRVDILKETLLKPLTDQVSNLDRRLSLLEAELALMKRSLPKPEGAKP